MMKELGGFVGGSRFKSQMGKKIYLLNKEKKFKILHR